MNLSSSTSSLPAALRIPLSSPAAFERIARLLSDRERDRSRIAQHLAYAQLQRRQQRSTEAEHDGTSSAEEGDGAEGSMFSASAGLEERNQDKNRYRDIICYNPTRILLPLGAERSAGSASVAADTSADRGYVNASLVQEPDLGLLPPNRTAYRRRWWVAAQAPIQNTLYAFISMLLTPPASLESTRNAVPPLPRMKTIVQLTPLVEQRRQKCHPYFPDIIGQTWFLHPDEAENEGGGPEDVWVRLEGKIERADGSRESALRVGRRGQKEEEGLAVTHLEYRGWSDHGVPEDSGHLIKFIRSTFDINDASTSAREDAPPILVHCSAGVGRTGTYITLASLLPFLENSFLASPINSTTATSSRSHPLGSTYPIPPPVKALDRDYVGETIDHLRDQRCTMVQTVAQVKFCYEALAREWKRLHL